MNSGTFGRIAGAITALFLAWITLPTGDASASDAVLLDFSSSRCGPCRAMQGVINQLEHQGVPVRHVNVDNEQALAVRYGVRQTPTYVVVAAGRELTRLVGMQSLDKLLQATQTNPSGPLVPTGSSVRHDSLEAPRTRLAAINRDIEFSRASRSRGSLSHSSSTSEAMPSVSMASAVERAQSATVRLRVHDDRGFGAGTGTIIDTHGDYALVLTCGHLFRENQGRGKIEVDLFSGGQVKTVIGQMISYDADERDIAVVQIQPGFMIQPVPVLSQGQIPRTGQRVFSFGCDRGDDPTRRDTRITGVNKYNAHLGASNIEISGAPIDGRSGGGLFDEQGRLVGVCNAADYKGDVGIYTGPGSVQWQLDQVKLSHLYQAPQSVAAPAPQARIAGLSAAPNPVRQASAVAPIRRPGENSSNASTGDREVIVIVRDRSGGSQVMTVREPTADLLQMIEHQAR